MICVLTAIFPDRPGLTGTRQNVPVLDFIGAKDDRDGSDNWSCKT